jgi:hypothetical protein
LRGDVELLDLAFVNNLCQNGVVADNRVFTPVFSFYGPKGSGSHGGARRFGQGGRETAISLVSRGPKA